MFVAHINSEVIFLFLIYFKMHCELKQFSHYFEITETVTELEHSFLSTIGVNNITFKILTGLRGHWLLNTSS